MAEGFDRAPLLAGLGAAGFALGDPVLIRIFKREKRLELWLRPGERFRLFRAYPILAASGGLGPKLKEGDRQAPEGFYRVGLRQLNPRSRHHLAFNLGFPNAYDEAHGRTGSALMVHGGESSVGCYAVGDAAIDQIYAVLEAALLAGQGEADVHAFPFHMSQAHLDAEAGHPWHAFWSNLKQGSDRFETTGLPPPVGVANGRYVFDGLETAAPVTGWR